MIGLLNIAVQFIISFTECHEGMMVVTLTLLPPPCLCVQISPGIINEKVGSFLLCSVIYNAKSGGLYHIECIAQTDPVFPIIKNVSAYARLVMACHTYME